LKNVASYFSNWVGAGSTTSARRAGSVMATSMTTSVSRAASASRMRPESASEWAGLPLSTTMAR
jgi:hypothetical protein